MWNIILAAALVVMIAGVIGLIAAFHRFTPIRNLGKRRRALSWLVAALPVAAVGLGFGLLINVPTAFTVVLHLLLIWLLCALFGRIIGAVIHKKVSPDITGLAAIALTMLYMGAGWYMAHHVFITEYSLTTPKDLGRDRLRIVEIADSHLGITLSGESFAREMLRVKALEPDMVVIVGDFVDDDTDVSDMRAACAALGGLNPPLGVHFVYGNHDNGYYRYRSFTSAELRQALSEAGVNILEDESQLIDSSFYLVGRRDRSMRDRAAAASLTAGLDPEKYTVMLDHQPNDYAAEAAAGADLVLSGHTHGGHLFPMGPIGVLIGANDAYYGVQTRGDTAFVVTSGISGWAVPIKTGTFSEMVVIDVKSGAER